MMNARTISEATAASVETVLGKISDAIAMAALDSALAGGFARHRGGTSSTTAP
ncbi:hypothetical protein K8F61_06405 [Microbacterium resistens]|uniref:Uncharacterized protein n=1 Tax=Microbacterium resistens TaxID=156977 RepID=A0ABY3RXR5_9MICO|nr:hypothetical protein [Microbacterium resistens]UGS27800.1 hypothetical protein K8F61_06405 [Microbacterium resistens]